MSQFINEVPDDIKFTGIFFSYKEILCASLEICASFCTDMYFLKTKGKFLAMKTSRPF